VTGFPDEALSCDAFLGGRLRLWQPRRGYRAGIDPLLLAAAVPARAGQSVLELGCGGGTAILSLATRIAGLALSGLEMQDAYADLARRNAAGNGVALEVVSGDLTRMPDVLRQRQFDHVIANPPYFDAARHCRGADPGRDTARAEATPLALWIDAASRRLAPGGHAHVIQRAERLPDLLAACAGRLGSVEILPLSARAGRAPHLLILRARKNGRAAFRLHAPMVLHEGATHDGDRDSYGPEIAAVLRDGAALNWP